MKGPTPLLLGALAAIVLLAVLAGARRRALLRAPGAFPAALLTPDGRRRGVIGRYDQAVLELASPWLPGRRAWRVARHRLEIERLPEPPAPGRALLRVHEAGAAPAQPFVLDVDEADAGAVRAWAEAGPSQASQSWWRAPGQA